MADMVATPKHHVVTHTHKWLDNILLENEAVLANLGIWPNTRIAANIAGQPVTFLLRGLGQASSQAVELCVWNRDIYKVILRIEGLLEQTFNPQDHLVYVAVPYTQLNRLRTRLAQAAKQKGYRLASYISSDACVWPNAQIGEHCFIFEQNVVQPFVRVGDNVVLWSGNHVGHHSVIGDNCFISSHVVISGFVEIGANCFLGVNSTIINNVKVGKDCWVGPSVTITKDPPDGTMYRPPRADVAPFSSLIFCGVES